MDRFRADAGQTTVEYALVLLAAAAVAILLINWASNDSGLTDFFTSIIEQIKSRIASG